MTSNQGKVVQATGPEAKNELFLPDFCSLKMVFSIVIIGQLLAFIITLAPLKLDQQRWNDLAMISLFIQWNGLVCSGVLCVLRPFFKSYSNQFVAITSYLILLLIITLISEVCFYIMESFQIKELVTSASHWEFLIHNLLIGGIICALALRYFYVQHQWRMKVEAETCTKLQLLQARIRPHFLFNSMNTIASLTRSNPDIAERVTEDLADLFRMLFKHDHEMITLRRELSLSKRYINIEKQRLGDRLDIEWDIHAIPADALVPALLLQPLLENAIFHGIEPSINGGKINVSGEFSNKQLTIKIENPHCRTKHHREGNKMALDNIRERLRVHYLGKATIECIEQGERYITVLQLPYVKEDT